MNKNELIKLVQAAQAEAGVKVNAAGTLNSKTKDELLVMRAELEIIRAEKAEPEQEPKPYSRKACVGELRAAGYEGPTSFLMPVLRELHQSFVVDGLGAEDALAAAKEGRKVR